MLIVDDDVWTVRAVTAALEDDPAITVLAAAATGEAGVAAFLADPADVVLMDINLGGGMSGVEATSAICKARPDARVVILSTIAPGPGLARAIEVGAVAVVHKSGDDCELIEAVHRAASEESPPLVRNLAAEIAASDPNHPQRHLPTVRLTARELETLRAICDGLDYESIAKAQSVAVTTVKAHTRSLREKLDASSLAQLVVRAIHLKYLGT